MRSIDDEIAHHLQQSVESGELSRTEGYGKPLAEAEGWHETPVALRMPFKVLKDAGVVPPEIELMRERAAVLVLIDQCADADRRSELQGRLNDLNVTIALRLERLQLEAR